MSDGKFWRALALYLADCHAASAETLPAKASKSQQNRHRSICETALAAITEGSSQAPLSLYWDGRSDERVLERLSRCAGNDRYRITEAGRKALEGK